MKVYIDHLRAMYLFIPLVICTMLPLEWAAYIVPFAWASVRIRDVEMPFLMRLTWWYGTYLVSMLLILQYQVFQTLPWTVFPYTLLKLHGVLSLAYLALLLVVRCVGMCYKIMDKRLENPILLPFMKFYH